VTAPYPHRIISRESGRTLAVFAVAAVVLLGSLGGYGLWDPDEGRHAAIARELFAATSWRGWLLPSHNFEPYYDKPILYYWLTSLAYGGVGVNEAGARLVSALAALATLVAVFRWTAAVAGVATARRAVLVLATSLGFVSLGRYGSLDMLLTCWITIGCLSAERFLAEPTRTVWLVVAAVAAALGMLTKGLVAPLFVAGIPLVHAFLAGRRLPRFGAWALALGIFLLVAGPWYVAAGILDPTYLHELFLQHHVARFTQEGTGFHPAPWWYYAPALALLLFPWSAILPAALAVPSVRRDPALRFCLCWAAVVVVFFSCSNGKLATYALPALPPLAIVVACGVRALVTAPGAGRLAAIGLATLVGALALAAPAVRQLDRAPWDALVAAGAPYLLLFPTAAIGVALAWWRRGLAGATSAIAACTAVACVVFYAGGAPIVSRVTSERGIADVITAHREAPIVSYAVTPASLMFYVGRRVVRVDRPRALRQLLAEQPFAWIVTTPRHVEAIGRVTPVYPWLTTGRRVLYATHPSSTVASASPDRAHD
jgi:4-amino-4-deoxy-L-arabinose transferase-like glycosyltransferase